MIIFLLFSFIYVLYRSMEAFHMLQQNLYNENNRYLKWLGKHLYKAFNILDFFPLLLVIPLFLTENKTFNDSALLISAAIYLYGTYLEYRRNKDSQNKIPLKATGRIKRLIFTIIIIYAIPMIFLVKLDEYFLLGLLLIGYIILIMFVYYTVYLALILNTPIDKTINYYYLKKAKKKLSEFNNLKIIGITGSYGKTSSKNILSEMLSTKYITKPSPLNYNTLKGLMVTVNNHLDKFDEVLIAEMGAYVPGEIKDICEFIKPKYGILTIIGEAHLETFKTKENIQKAKFELIESLDSNGLAILNMDDPYQVNYELKNKVSVKWISMKNKEADYYADNIHYSHNGMSFDCHYGDETLKLKTKLLGKHHIYNILAGVALSVEFGISKDDIVGSVASLTPVEHRLELKKIGRFYQLDDAYNSNPIGAKNALEVLSLMPGDKCVVTPGMIELGKEEQKKNYEFGKNISEVADWVILIGKKRTQDIYKGLIDNNFDKDKIFIINSVVESYKRVNSLIDNSKTMYALYENDLPDIYTEE